LALAPEESKCEQGTATNTVSKEIASEKTAGEANASTAIVPCHLLAANAFSQLFA
jgi:hypothetical protein